MAATPVSRQPSLPLAPAVAAVAGLVVVALVALVPAWRIEAAVMASGLPSLLPAAAPPLGWTARVGLMLGFGGLVTVLLWLGLMLLAPQATLPLPRRKPKVKPRRAEVPPSVRRADAHPDAPPRPPVRADRDLGTPFLDAPVATVAPDGERPLPRDLDTPMAMFDPEALPAAPAAPTPTVKPLFRPETAAPPEEPQAAPLPAAQAQDETPPPPVEPVPEPSIEAAPEPATPAPKPHAEPSLSALLARLDQGLSRRDPAPTPADPTPEPQPAATPEPPAPRVPAGLAATLGQLRRMATGDKE